nr:vacuolar membrane amino acid uptake transporter fnx2 [Quercus suber]
MSCTTRRTSIDCMIELAIVVASCSEAEAAQIDRELERQQKRGRGCLASHSEIAVSWPTSQKKRSGEGSGIAHGRPRMLCLSECDSWSCVRLPCLRISPNSQIQLEHDATLVTDEEVFTEQPQKISQASVYATIAILLIGVFISQTDQRLVLATYGEIASEFDDFELGSWLLSAYILAQCVAQPLYGKLSDIYGRKACLQASYIIFAIGLVLIGSGNSMGELIAYRAVQGAGAAGMVSMVSIIITDLVPLQDVASMRSYVNVLQTIGRGCGGVIGGFLTQTLGWRWTFLIQVPPIILAILLVQWFLRLAPREGELTSTKWEKLKRVDFLGAVFLCSAILSICLILDTGGQSLAWSSLPIKIFAVVGGVASIAFAINSRYVQEPIFPLGLLRQYVVVTNYLLSMVASTGQLSLILVVPVFFQATRGASVAAAGAYLIPAFVGNSIGGIVSGLWIKRTGRFKACIVLAPFMTTLCYTLCYTTWDDNTSIWKSLAILPGGFGTALISSATFVGLAAGVAEADLAVAASGMYLASNVGAIGGTSIGSAVHQMALRAALNTAVEGREDGSQIVHKALDSISFVRNADADLRRLLVPAFVASFHAVNILGFCCAAISIVLAVSSRGTGLRQTA